MAVGIGPTPWPTAGPDSRASHRASRCISSRVLPELAWGLLARPVQLDPAQGLPAVLLGLVPVLALWQKEAWGLPAVLVERGPFLSPPSSWFAGLVACDWAMRYLEVQTQGLPAGLVE